MKATESFNRISTMPGNWPQLNLKLQNSDSLFLIEETLRSLLATAPSPFPQQPVFPHLILPPTAPLEFKPSEQPLDLSMKTERSPIEDFGYGGPSERFIDLPDLDLENSLPSGRNAKEYRGVRNSPVLWQFLLNCLNSGEFNPSVVEWVCKEQGVFRLTNAKILAQLWGEKKHKPNMSEENLKRSLRQIILLR
ncbi:hypothetical protein Aperf_G00000031483 [Anoplocephala perfoliata]